MATISPISCVVNIGKVAGIVWQTLSEKGPLKMTKLVKTIGEPHDTVMQALGWLAREDKINIADDSRNPMVSLRE
jgi:hypothetical protein